MKPRSCYTHVVFKLFLARLFLFVLLLNGILFGAEQNVSAQPAQIILIRHAEKNESEEDIYLNERGRERARAYVQYFTRNQELLHYGLPSALYAMKQKSQLTLQ